jgi:hypothetical protein
MVGSHGFKLGEFLMDEAANLGALMRTQHDAPPSLGNYTVIFERAMVQILHLRPLFLV